MACQTNEDRNARHTGDPRGAGQAPASAPAPSRTRTEDELIDAAMRQEFRPGDGNDRLCRSPTAPPLPERIGPYRIIRRVGVGGMGVVYEAQQTEPTRRVALKVIRDAAGAGTRDARLFQREIDALARLRHPSIAQIYDAGHTDDGTRYFVMELIEGRPLIGHCALEEMPPTPRLELFVRVCRAVQYAHDHGVIHRDLKPSNILIDGGGNPKVLDFGLARITDSDVAITTVATEAGRIQGTLPYMSPEQARSDPAGIGDRSDIYSLGVILYELLTERLPYDVTRPMLHEAVRVICEDPPRRPSTMIRSLRGDLETIVLKALEKEPRRRYPSAAALADDLERYLSKQPILARPPTAIYQFRKLIARHKAPFAFVAALFILITGFAVWMSVLYAQAERLREQERWKSYVANVVAAREALASNEVSTAHRQLEAAPEEHRGWEWRYLSAASDQSLAVLRGHKGGVMSVTFSPDGATGRRTTAAGSSRPPAPETVRPSTGGGTRPGPSPTLASPWPATPRMPRGPSSRPPLRPPLASPPCAPP